MDTVKKVLLSVGVVAVIGIYIIFQYMGKGNAPIVATDTTGLGTVDQQTTTTPPPVGTSTPTPTPTPTPQGQYKDGSYTGSVADAFYGPVQVKATVSGGKLTNVQFLQYPNERGNTSEISQRVMPILKQEAIAAQSAQVNVISGATQTSEGFTASLGVALAQAKA